MIEAEHPVRAAILLSLGLLLSAFLVFGPRIRFADEITRPLWGNRSVDATPVTRAASLKALSTSAAASTAAATPAPSAVGGVPTVALVREPVPVRASVTLDRVRAVRGSVPSAALKKALNQRRDALGICHRPVRAVKRGDVSRVQLRWVLDRQGELTRVDVNGSDLAPDTEPCLRSALAGLELPRARGNGATLTARVTFVAQ